MDKERDTTVLTSAVDCLRGWVNRNNHYGDISQHMLVTTMKYLLYGDRVGDFLTALIEKRSWTEVLAKADDDNIASINTWHLLLVNIFPSIAWGDEARRVAWQKSGGTSGRIPSYLYSYRQGEWER